MCELCECHQIVGSGSEAILKRAIEIVTELGLSLHLGLALAPLRKVLKVVVWVIGPTPLITSIPSAFPN